MQTSKPPIVVLALASVLSIAGCETPPWNGFGQSGPSQKNTTAVRDPGVPAKPDPARSEVDVTKIDEHDDIYEIASLMPNNPWIRLGGRVVGMRVPAYFVSGSTRRGAYVSGTILAWVYGFEAGADGKAQRVPLHIWEFDRAEAMNWRITKRSVMGYPYMFLLRWPESLNLEGRTVELELGYERSKDKQVVVSPAKRLKVPGSDLPPIEPAVTPSPSRMATSRKGG